MKLGGLLAGLAFAAGLASNSYAAPNIAWHYKASGAVTLIKAHSGNIGISTKYQFIVLYNKGSEKYRYKGEDIIGFDFVDYNNDSRADYLVYEKAGRISLFDGKNDVWQDGKKSEFFGPINQPGRLFFHDIYSEPKLDKDIFVASHARYNGYSEEEYEPHKVKCIAGPGYVTSFNLETGLKNWQTKIENMPLFTSPALNHDSVFVAFPYQGRVCQLDKSTGRIKAEDSVTPKTKPGIFRQGISPVAFDWNNDGVKDFIVGYRRWGVMVHDGKAINDKQFFEIPINSEFRVVEVKGQKSLVFMDSNNLHFSRDKGFDMIKEFGHNLPASNGKYLCSHAGNMFVFMDIEKKGQDSIVRLFGKKDKFFEFTGDDVRSMVKDGKTSDLENLVIKSDMLKHSPVFIDDMMVYGDIDGNVFGITF